MVESTRDAWHDITKRTQDTGADGIELNFGCPHGMSERGMGSAVGQVPDYTCMITEWVKEVATIPVMVKLTPNVADVTAIGRAAVRGGADALSLINTVNSIMGVDLDTLAPKPAVRGAGQSRRLLRPGRQADRTATWSPRWPVTRKIKVPISGIGGIQAWQDAVEFLLLGAGSVQVCTAVMHYGFRIVEHLMSGLENWMREKGFESVGRFVGRSVPRIKPWGDLDLNYKVVAEIDQQKCIHCGLCYIACEDGATSRFVGTKFQWTISLRKTATGWTTLFRRHSRCSPAQAATRSMCSRSNEHTCVGCNMCSLVCPVEDCITMKDATNGKPPMTLERLSAAIGGGKSRKD